MFRKILKVLGFMLLIIVVIGMTIFVIYYPTVKKLYYGERTQSFDKALTIFIGGGGNSVVFESDSAVMVVDTKYGKAAEKLFNHVTKLANGRPIIVINTHSDLDHTGGNPLFTNSTIISGKVDEAYWAKSNNGKGMPNIWVTDTMTLPMGDETITLIPMGQAHTWNDIVVYFNKRKLLMTGDLIFNKMNVFFGTEKGSDGRKAMEAVRRLKEIPLAETIVPGHGDVGGPELIDGMLEYYEDMAMAADNPEKEKEVKAKYKDWTKMPMASSPSIVIKYFREHK
jgi:glyoxylase-like metal-dependent hydrolase (beta-lactamase superfamily II)